MKKVIKSEEYKGMYQYEYHRKDGSVTYSKPFHKNSGRKAEGENTKNIDMESNNVVNALKTMNYGGKVSDSMLEREFGIKPQDASKIGWDKYIESNRTPSGEREWSITQKGREHLEQIEGQKVYRYKSQTRDEYYKHDLKLSEEIASRINHGEVKEMYSEAQIRSMFENEMKRLEKEDYSRFEELNKMKLSPPDFVYKDQQGNMVAIEVVSENYTTAQIQAKMDFCSVMNFQYTSVAC